MTDFAKLLVLSAVQGLTEFLPVSSSAHLSVAERLLSLDSPGPGLELFMHAGTLATVCVFYRSRIRSAALDMVRLRASGWRYALCIVLSALPAGVFYALGAEDRAASVCGSMRAVGALMILNGAMLAGFSALARSPRGGDVTPWRALAMGLGQALAMLPGVSRSGTSIGAGRLAGMGAAQAAEFSFLMSVPPIAGAILAEALKAESPCAAALPCGPGGFAAAALVSGLVGYAALSLVVRVLERGRFWAFGVYCAIAGAAVLAFAR